MKRRIVEEMVRHRSQSQADASRAVDEVFGAIGTVLRMDERVTVPDFGTFKQVVRDTAERRNPRTGEKVIVASRTAVKFTEKRQRTR